MGRHNIKSTANQFWSNCLRLARQTPHQFYYPVQICHDKATAAAAVQSAVAVCNHPWKPVFQRVAWSPARLCSTGASRSSSTCAVPQQALLLGNLYLPSGKGLPIMASASNLSKTSSGGLNSAKPSLDNSILQFKEILHKFISQPNLKGNDLIIQCASELNPLLHPPH